MLTPYLQLPFKVDLTVLQAEVQQCLDQQWVNHYNQKDYEGDWTLIALRSIDGAMHQVSAQESDSYRDTPLLSQCPHIQHFLDQLKCDKMSIRLMRLAAGSVIKAHRDNHLGYEDGSFRLHLPIWTNDQVIFYIDGKPVHMEVGSCWYANFNLEHSVVNKGESDRVHLVVDCLRNKWSDEMMREAGYDFEAEKAAKRTIDPAAVPEMIALLKAMNTPAAQTLIDQLQQS